MNYIKNYNQFEPQNESLKSVIAGTLLTIGSLIPNLSYSNKDSLSEIKSLEKAKTEMLYKISHNEISSKHEVEIASIKEELERKNPDINKICDDLSQICWSENTDVFKEYKILINSIKNIKRDIGVVDNSKEISKLLEVLNKIEKENKYENKKDTILLTTIGGIILTVIIFILIRSYNRNNVGDHNNEEGQINNNHGNDWANEFDRPVRR